MKTLTLKEKEIKRLDYGHWWIFSNEIEAIDTSIEKGALCRFEYKGGRACGTGFFNPHSLIAGRLLTKNSYSLEDNFIKNRIERAFNYRRELGLEKSSRIFFGESDFIGGLVIDKYEDVLVAEILSAGADRLKTEIVKGLQEIFSPSGIIIKRDHQYRALEGLELKENEIIGKDPEEVVIEENGLKFSINLMKGQKTGWYFDQRENRTCLIPYFKNRKVLDLYCYGGAFSLLAAASGAGMVWGVDSSAKAVENAVCNAKLNGIPPEKAVFKEGDAQETLNALEKGELPVKPDFVLLDPPNFVRSKKSLEQAKKLYVKLLSQAARGVEKNGLVAFSTCSHHISQEVFREILNKSTGLSKRKTLLLELRMQAKDHPILLGMEETKYLNFALLRAI